MLRKLQLVALFVAMSLASFGQDWIAVSSDLPAGLGIGQISISMNDANAVWAAAINSDGTINDRFTRSTDGGQTWTTGTFNAGTGLSQIFAIDANTCWAVFNTGANQGLYKTENGGVTWVKKGTAYGSGSFANVIHFFNDNDGFAQGDPLGGYYELYTTTDGGETWNRVPQADIPAPTTGEYGITGNYSAVGNSIWWGTNQGRVFYSSDKGYTWGATITPFGTTNVVQPLFKNEDVGIVFRSYLDMGIEPELSVSTDGGATYSSVLVNGNMYARWFNYIPGTSGTWVGSSSEPGFEGISYTLDDGANWIDLTVGVPVQSPVFVDNQTGWAGTWSDGSSTGILIYNGAPIGGASVEIMEDFEAYDAGGKLVEQALAAGLDYWTCWSGDGGAGGTEDGTITTEQAFAGDNSVLVDGVNDFVMLFGDKTAGKYSVEFYMYVPTGFVGYYNILQAFGPGGSGAVWGLEVYFNPGGIAELTAENTTPLTTFNYPYDTWFKMENIIDLNTDEATLMFDGAEVATWQWSVGASGGGLNQLAAMDIYAAATNGTPKFFMDEIQVLELEPPVGPAQIAVSPEIINVSLESGQSATETLGITNSGVAKLIWNAYPDFGMSETEAVVFDHNENTDYKSLVEETSMIKTNGEAHPGTDATHVFNYDGENFSAVGLTAGGTFSFGAKFPTNLTNPYIGMEIGQVEVFLNTIVSSSTIRVYGHGANNSPGVLLSEQTFSALVGWNTVTLDTPAAVNGGDIWITCEVTHLPGDFPAGNDEGPHTPNGDWFSTGPSWVQLHEANPDIDANWNIRGIATGDAADAWIMLDPQSGEANSGVTNNVSVTVDATGVPEGIYTANIVINSNDPANPQVVVPVILTVTGGTPPSSVAYIDFEDVLDWSQTFAPWTAVDIDGQPTYGFTGITFPGSGTPMSYLAFNPDTTDPPMSDDEEIQPYGGERFGAVMASVPSPGGNDDWLISPQVQLGSGSAMNMWAKSYTDQYGLERFNVGVSTTGMEPGDFTIISQGPYTEAPTSWTEFSYDLSDYDGQLVYVGIQCVSNDAFVFMVDDIEVTSIVGVEEINDVTDTFKVYPNPAKTNVFIESSETIESVTILNVTGQIVYRNNHSENKIQINTAEFAEGLYLMQIKTANGISTQKLIIE